MTTFLVILFLIFLTIRKIIINYKLRATIALDIIYDKMELYVATHNLVIDRHLRNYLVSFKTIKVNPEFADLQVLFGLARMIPPQKLEELKQENAKFVNELPKELKTLGIEFNKRVTELVNLNAINGGFLIFLSYMLLRHIVKSIVRRSFNEMSRVRNKVKEVRDNDLLIAGFTHCIS